LAAAAAIELLSVMVITLIASRKKIFKSELG
jgi:hypothetical protein